MSGSPRPLRLTPFDEAALAPYGQIIRPPSQPGERAFYTEWLADQHPGTSIRLHTNTIVPSTPPYAVHQLERHPRTAQIFIPLNVSRYVALVTAMDETGGPDLATAMAMILPGDRGIVFAKGVWHAGASVLDHIGSFCVLHYRNDTSADDEILALTNPFDVQI